jgi:hypothetical protein
LYSSSFTLFSASIASIKMKDMANTPRYNKYSKDLQARIGTTFNRNFVAHSTFRSTPGGFSSSASAAEFYCQLAEMKRKEIIAKYRGEME